MILNYYSTTKIRLNLGIELPTSGIFYCFFAKALYAYTKINRNIHYYRENFRTFAVQMQKHSKRIEKQHLNAAVRSGLRDGIPIAMGYLAVAFSLGIIAAKAGLTAPEGFLNSFFTRASAGEYGVYTLVAVQAAYVEVVAMCLVANLKYMLMSAALSQKIAPGTAWWKRLLMACCVTDEIFGISIAYRGYTPPAYTYAAALISTLFWASGCAIGITAGSLLPQPMTTALSMSLYGMFLAIIIPPAHQDRNVLYALLASFTLSGLCALAPVVSQWSSGTRTVMLTILISAVAAWLRPIKTDHDGTA
jgi:predicted branched-subunit amino acid permease